MDEFVRRLLSDPAMLRMGHGQRMQDLNLGLGWVYYALARAARPRRAVVIGSYRGFAPAIIAKALLDNGEGGQVDFIDPSLADPFWRDAAAVARHFESLGTPNITHHLYTTQEFMSTPAYARLEGVGLLMVDGYHTAEQARFDYLAFLRKLAPDALTLFHDSLQRRSTAVYGEDKRYRMTVWRFMERLRATPGLEVFTLPVDQGLTFVRGVPATLAPGIWDDLDAKGEEPAQQEPAAVEDPLPIVDTMVHRILAQSTDAGAYDLLNDLDRLRCDIADWGESSHLHAQRVLERLEPIRVPEQWRPFVAERLAEIKAGFARLASRAPRSAAR
jgi:hypothetical protein